MNLLEMRELPLPPLPYAVPVRDLWRIIPAYLCTMLSFWAITSLTGLILAQRGVAPATIGLFAATPWLAVLLATPLLPPLIQQLGLLRAFQLGIVLALLAVGGFATTQTLWLWFGCNLLLGLALGIHWIVADSWVNTAAPPNKRGEIVGLYEGISSVLIGGGPLIVASTGSVGWHSLGVAAALLGCAFLPLVGATSPHLPSVGSKTTRNLLGFVRYAPVMLLTAFLGGLVETAGIGLFPVYGLALGLPARVATLLVTALALGNILTQYPIGYLADRISLRRVLLGSVIGVMLGPLVWMLTTPTSFWMWLVIFLWGGAVGGLYTLAAIQAGSDFSGSQLVQAFAAVTTSYTLGSIIGPVVGGAALTLWPPHGLPVTLAGLTALVLVVLLATGQQPANSIGLHAPSADTIP